VGKRPRRTGGTNSLELELSRFPISGATASVCYGNDLDERCGDAINDGVRKTAEEILPSTVRMHRPSLRSALDFPDRVIELGYKSICRGGIPFSIPPIGGSYLRDGLGMELNVWTSHEPDRGFDVARPTKEPSSPLPYSTHQYDARFRFPTPLPRLHRLRHPSFQADEPRARRVLQEADGELLLRLFCDSESSREFYISPSHQHKFQIAEAQWLGS
jgi:hypothetical protein